MNSIDSYKLTLDVGTLKDVNFGKFDRQINIPGATSGDEILPVNIAKQDKYVCVNPGFGIKRIEINDTTNRMILQGSAKVLKEQYFEGINVNTFERVIQAYNDTGLIKLDPVDVMQSAELFSVDVSKNMVMDREPWQYIRALKMLRVNERYQVAEYRNPGSKAVNGITFKGHQRSFKERQIFYDKETDVGKDPEMRQYVGKFRNVLRAEMNLVQLRRIRHYFGSNMLQDVLKSDTNANYLLFEKINSKASNNLIRLFDEFEGVPLYQVEKIKGRETIIRDICLMDWDLIVQWIKSKVQGKPSRYMKEYRELYQGMLQQESKGVLLHLNNPLLEELTTKLKVA